MFHMKHSGKNRQNVSHETIEIVNLISKNVSRETIDANYAEMFPVKHFVKS